MTYLTSKSKKWFIYLFNTFIVFYIKNTWNFIVWISIKLLSHSFIPFLHSITDGMDSKVAIGLHRSLGLWKWQNGKLLAITHSLVSDAINNVDLAVNPCNFDYCGIFRAVSFADFRIFDNCCNNLLSSFVCSTVILI